jgi:HEAT repeat protein
VVVRALGDAPVRELERRLDAWARGDARLRAAACEAAAGVATPARWRHVTRGLADADATVRAACLGIAAATPADARVAPAAATVARVRALLHDRDQAVRAAAIAALARLAPPTLATLAAADDPAAEVRVAYARALAMTPAPPLATLRVLADDDDPDVRAAALGALAEHGAALGPALALRAADDPAPQVRRAAVGGLTDERVLTRLAADDSPEVRTAAEVRIATRLGQAAAVGPLLRRLATEPAASAARVRLALAYLVAPP